VTSFRQKRDRSGVYMQYRVESRQVFGSASGENGGPMPDGENGEERVEVVWKRFSEFGDLVDRLAEEGYELRGVALPSKVFGTAAESRVKKLDALVRGVVKATTVDGCLSTAPKVLLDFLGVASWFEFKEKQQVVGSWLEHEPVPEEYRDMIENAIDELLKLEKIYKGEGGASMEELSWKHVGREKTVCWYSHPETERRMAYGTIPQSTSKMIKDIFYDNKLVRRIETSMDQVKTLEVLNSHTRIDYILAKSIMWLPPRDVIMVRHWRVLEDGAIVDAQVTIDSHHGAPEKDTGGKVRATQTFGGFVIRQEAPTRSSILIATDLDPRVTSAPASVQRRMLDYSASMLAKNLANLFSLAQSKDLKRYVEDGPLGNRATPSEPTPENEDDDQDIEPVDDIFDDNTSLVTLGTVCTIAGISIGIGSLLYLYRR